MFGTLLRIGVVVVLAAMAGEFLSPPFSCWLLHVVSPRDGGGAGSAMVLVQPGGGGGPRQGLVMAQDVVRQLVGHDRVAVLGGQHQLVDGEEAAPIGADRAVRIVTHQHVDGR